MNVNANVNGNIEKDNTEKKKIVVLEVPERIIVDSEIKYRARAQEVLPDGSLGEIKIIDFSEETLREMFNEIEKEEKRRYENMYV